MTKTTAAFAGDTFGVEVNPPHGVRLRALIDNLCSNVQSEGDIDDVIHGLHLELEAASVAMKTALRKLRETPLFDDDDA